MKTDMLKRLGSGVRLFLLLLSVVFLTSTALRSQDVGSTKVFWAHNFQFFAYDYRIGATLQEAGENALFYVENSRVLSGAVDESNELLYVGTAHGGVFSRAINAEEWSPMTRGLPTDPNRKGFSAVNALTFSGNGTLIAGTDHGLFVYDANQERWRNTGITEAVWTLLADGSNVYAGLGGYHWSDDSDQDGDIDVRMGVRYSADNGSSWSVLSAGLPTDNDNETREVSSLTKSGEYIVAVTPGGLFYSRSGESFWRANQRDLKLSAPNVEVELTESSRDEAQQGGDFFRQYSRWLTVDQDAVADGAEITVTLRNSPIGDDSISQWVCPVQEGILGDEGEYLISLEAATGYYNVSGLFSGYDTLSLDDMVYAGQSGMGAIINPRSEVLLIVADTQNPESMLGGKYATVTFSNGTDSYIWSAKIEPLREPNKGSYGVRLSNTNLVSGGNPNYLMLNREEPASFSAVTVGSMSGVEFVTTSNDGSTLYGVAGNAVYQSGDNGNTWEQLGSSTDAAILKLFQIDNQLFIATDTRVMYLDGNSWKPMPYVIPFTPSSINTLFPASGTLYAGSEMGLFSFQPSDSTWSPENRALYGYIESTEVSGFRSLVDETTPADPNAGIYDILTETFGQDRLPDIDNSDQLTVLLHDIHDISEPWNNTSNGSAGGIDQIHGYIRVEDQSNIGRTNKRDMIYIDTKASETPDRGAAFAHQMVLLMLLNEDPDEERWINEGIAFFGEKLCGFDMPSIWVDFAQSATAPGAITLVSGTPTVSWGVNPDGGSAVAELYTKTAMWSTYLYENLGGLDFLKALMSEPGNGVEGIDNVLPDFTPSGVDSLTFEDVYTGWALAYTINNPDWVDEETQLRYGYLDSTYSSIIEDFRSKNGDSVGVKVQPLQPDESMENYEKIQQPGSYDQGLNNWATVYRSFFHLASTGGPAAWVGKVYHFNGADDKTFRIWLLKHKTGGGFELEELTGDLNSENELHFNVLDQFEPNSDTTEYTYDKVMVGISNQTRLGGSARFVQSTDVTPPELDVSFIHNAFYPEFLGMYIFGNEPFHKDVTSPETPGINAIQELDTTNITPEVFRVTRDATASKAFTGTIYKTDMRLPPKETITFQFSNIQDIAGNDTEVPDKTVSVQSVEKLNKQHTLALGKNLVRVDVPSGALAEPTTLTLFEGSPRAYTALHNLPEDLLNRVTRMYTVGPSALHLQRPALLEISLDEKLTESQGLYSIQGDTAVVPVPAEYDRKSGILRATLDRLGTYVIAEALDELPVVKNLPERYALSQNYPNPFNPSTRFNYTLPRDGYTRVAVYDLAGRLVTTLVNEYQRSGSYQVNWDGTNGQGVLVSSGVYLYSLSSGEFTTTRKMILLR